MERIILLLDFDYFYAQVEERDNPTYRGKPLVVCVYSGRSENSGAVATCNYEARKLGIRAGMPISFARNKASEETVFLPVRIDYYRELSSEIMDMLRGIPDKFEQVSVDEAYMDISEKAENYGKAAVFARQVKKQIRDKYGLTCSVGIGPNKLIAKMSAGLNKPDGLTIIKPGEISGFLNPLPVSKLFGVGPKMAEVLGENGIKTVGDLAAFDTGGLKKLFGENKGLLLHNRAMGADDEPVEESDKQQVSRIATLKEDSRDFEKIMEVIDKLAETVCEKTRGVSFRTISIIVINTVIQAKTRSITLDRPASDVQTIKEKTSVLLKEFLRESGDEIRRVGVRVSNFSDNEKVNNKGKQPGLKRFFS